MTVDRASTIREAYETGDPRIVPCPLLRPKGLNPRPRAVWVREANRLCDHPDHRYSDAMHVPVDVELARIRGER